MTDRRLPLGVGTLAGGVAGLLVGIVDGIRSAALVGSSVTVAVSTALLAASVDGVIGVLAGAILESMGRMAAWGRRGRAPLAAQVTAFVLVGGMAAGATFATAVATAGRNNRFLAAGLNAIAGL